MSVVQITGTGTSNKGAELMFIAAAEFLRAHDPSMIVAVDPWFGSYGQRAKYGVHTLMVPTRLGRSSLATLLPRPFRRCYGLINQNEIDFVLDASGFAFSSQFGVEPTARFLAQAKLWAKRRVNFVLLPQAFGPFKEMKIRRQMTEILNLATLVFARDQMSLDSISELAPQNQNLRLAPDFTPLVGSAPPDSMLQHGRFAAIVPNSQMIVQTSSKSYLPFLRQCIAECVNHDLEPLLVLHENSADEGLVPSIISDSPTKIRVIREEDPKRLKGLLSRMTVVIGSRFHALVSALSQGIPSVGIGWSHKYDGLFLEYQSSDCLLSPHQDVCKLGPLLTSLTSGAAGKARRDLLKQLATQHREKVVKMWREIEGCLH